MRHRLLVVEPFAALIGEEVNSLAMPLWAPWPVSIGWTFSGLAHTEARDGGATVSCWSGPDPFGDPAEMLLICEEAGAGVGGHFAGLSISYPTPGVGEGPPHAKFEVASHPVPLWAVDTSVDRAAYAGEAAGRWLWVVVHPAESSSIVVQPMQLVDARQLGAELTVLPVGELSPRLVID